MLESYYDCVDKYLSREDFIYCEMDTDSAYMAISGDSFEALIKPELREEFEKDKHNWFVTPLVSESSPGQVKFSMKGVNKKQFKNPMPHYEHVLNTKENFRACNQGI